MDEFSALRAAFGVTAGEGLAALGQKRALADAVAPYLQRYGLTPCCHQAREVYAGMVPAGRFVLWCQVWAPPAPRGTVFVVHGYFDHAGLYRHLLAMLLARGFQVVLWDLPGHGLSSGEHAAIDDFAAYVACLRTVQAAVQAQTLAPGPWLGIGQSTGAAILATDALERPRVAPWAGLALLAPLVRPWGWHRASALHRLVHPFTRTIARRYRPNSHDAAFVAFIRRHDPLQHWQLSLVWVAAMRRWMARFKRYAPCELPTLMLQGEQDRTVDWRYNLAVMAEKFPRAQIYRHPRARHHLVNEALPIREALFAELGGFLEQRATPQATLAGERGRR